MTLKSGEVERFEGSEFWQLLLADLSDREQLYLADFRKADLLRSPDIGVKAQQALLDIEFIREWPMLLKQQLVEEEKKDA